MNKLALFSVFLVLPLMAQAPVPKLTTAERIALRGYEKQKQHGQEQVQRAVHQEQILIVKFEAAHPGYQLNGTTFAVERDLSQLSPSTATKAPAKK